MSKDSKTNTDLDSTGLTKCHFFYKPGMQTNQMELNSIFLQYVASKFSQSTKVTLLAETLVVTEVDCSKLPRFKTKQDKEDYLYILEFQEQEEYQETKEDYQKFSCIIRKNLAAVYGILETLCHISLRSRLKVELEYQKMMKDNLFSAITLCKLICKICN